MTARVCPTCGEPADLAGVPEVAMQADDVVVRVRGLAVATCRRGHRTVLPEHAATRVAGEVDDRLVTARTRGLVRRRATCGACDADLVLPPRHTDRPVPVDVDGLVVTTVVEAPMLRCPDCGREQMPTSVAAAVPGLLEAAVGAVQADATGP